MRFRAPLFAATLLVTLTHIASAEIHGRVVDAVTGHGVEGATVSLDLSPADGTLEHTTETGPFGYYLIGEGAAPSEHILQIAHPGYETLSTAFTPAPGVTVKREDPLTPIALQVGETVFDILVRVSCVSTNQPLRGVPVKFWRFGDDTTGLVDETRVLHTDIDGHASFRGVRSGYYEFRINNALDAGASGRQEKWLHLPKGASNPRTPRQRLLQSHQLNAMLQPVAQGMRVRVLGFDPVTSADDVPLSGTTVEITGLEVIPGLGGPVRRTILPTRSGVTNDDGEVVFSKLPNVVYRLEAKRLGYDRFETYIDPAAHGGCLPGDPIGAPYDVSLAYHPTHLFLTALHPYEEEDIFNILEFKLTGLPNSNTAGVERAALFYNIEGLRASRVFNNLLPGRYMASVDARPTAPPNNIAPHFIGRKIVEVPLGDPAFGGFNSEEITLPLNVGRAKVRGRVWIADEATRDPLGRPDQPVYAPAPAGLGLQLVETLANPLLPPNLRNIGITTDADGGFVLDVLPSRYGLRMEPALAGYAAGEVRVRNLDPPIESERETVGPWAYPELEPGALGGSFYLRTRDNYEIDIFIDRQLFSVTGSVWVGLPVVPYDLSSGAGRITLTDNSSGEERFAPLDEVAANLASYRFDGVPPGDYTIRASHPRFTFEYGSPGSTSHSLTIAPLSLPGVFPAPAGAFSTISRDITATYTQGGAVLKRRIFTWSGASYDTPPAENMLSYTTQADYAGKVRGFGGIPQGGFQFWHRVLTPLVDGWLEGTVPAGTTGDVVFDIYNGGPKDNIDDLLDGRPPLPLDLTVRVVNAVDPASPVTGVTSMQFTDSSTGDTRDIDVSAGGTAQLNNYLGPLEPDAGSVTNPFWVYSGDDSRLVDRAAGQWETSVLMLRAVSVTGKITDDATIPAPIPEAAVALKTRYGELTTEEVADSEGDFAFPQPLAAPFFLDYCAAGYQPHRERRTPNEAQPVAGGSPGDAELDATASLEELPTPTVNSFSLDRYGLFLPGVGRAGSHLPGTYADASGTLTLTWTCSADAEFYTDDRPPFDAADGGNSGPGSEVLVDPISEIWIIDPRYYFGNPVGAQPTPLPLPADTPVARTKFLADIVDGTLYPNVFFQKVSGEDLSTSGLTTTATGEIRLWDLPPGEFHPLFAVVTAGGAVTLDPYIYPPGESPLRGAETTPTLALVADLAGTVAGVIQTNQVIADAGVPGLVGQDLDVGSFLSGGRLEAKPQFTATITETDGYLDYAWSFGATITEGQAMPATGIAGFGPGIAGLSLDATAEVNVFGRDGEVALALQGDATSEEDVDVSRYLPSSFFGLDLVDSPTLKPGISLRTEHADILDPANPLESQLRHTVVGSAVMKASVDLTPVAQRAPYVGPVLTALEKFGKVALNVDSTGALRLESRTAWSTLRPEILETGPSGTTDHRRRRHFLGGDERTPPGTPPGSETSMELGFNLGADLRLTAGRATVKGGIALVGEERRFPGIPDPVRVATVEINSDADWPYIKKVQGALNLNAGASYDAGYFELNKEWSWDVLTFNIELNTEPVFELVPVDIVQRVTRVSDGDEATFGGLAPQPVGSLSERAPFTIGSALGASEAPIAFSDTDPATGEARLRVSPASGVGTWAAPSTVRTAGAITEVQLVELAADEWLLVWAEIDSAFAASAFPPVSLASARSTDGGTTWGSAVVLYDSGNWIEDLRLVTAPALLAVLFVESTSYLDQLRAIRASRWDGAVWSTAETVRPAGELLAFDVAGGKTTTAGDGFAMVGYVDGDSEVWAQPWGPSGLPTAVKLGDAAEGQAHLALGGSDDRAFAFWTAADAGIAMAKNDPDDVWVGLGTPLAAATVGDLAVAYLPHPSDPVVAVGWTGGGGVRLAVSAFVSPDGFLFLQPGNLTENEVGAYTDLSVTPLPNRTARYTARFTNSPSELRTFTVSYPSGISNDDRDSDGLRDIDEFKIIDHDPADAVGDISHVSPDGDYDLDGFTNGDEIAANADPTNPLSIPVNGPAGSGLREARIEFLPDGGTRVVVTAEAGGRYHLEVSSDLDGYVRVETQPGIAGVLEFYVSPSSEVERQFYRVIRED